MSVFDAASCEHCGRPMKPRASNKGSRRKYCSHACRQRAYELRHDITLGGTRGETPEAKRRRDWVTEKARRAAQAAQAEADYRAEVTARAAGRRTA